MSEVCHCFVEESHGVTYYVCGYPSPLKKEARFRPFQHLCSYFIRKEYDPSTFNMCANSVGAWQCTSRQAQTFAILEKKMEDI